MKKEESSNNNMFPKATDAIFLNLYKGRAGLVIGGGYRSKDKSREYQRCEKLDRFNGIKIGCNSAFNVCELDVICWIDSSTYRIQKDKLTNFHGWKFYMNPKPDIQNVMNFYSIKGMNKEEVATSFDEPFGPKNLSGFMAINIAILLGLDPIYLTGFNSTSNSILKRSVKMKMFRNWCNENGRHIYTTDEVSSMPGIFEYKDLDSILKG